MEVKDLEKMISEEPKKAENLEFMENAENEEVESIKDGENEDIEKSTTNINLANFGDVLTGVYCNISDLIYKKIKKTDKAPNWGDAKNILSSALNEYLKTVNVEVKPIYALLGSVVAVEAMRYSGLFNMCND